jgi:putative transposase
VRRGAYSKVEIRNKATIAAISELKAEHPFWGYRRVTANLNAAHEKRVNKKSVQRLMQKHGLTVKRNEALRATRTPKRGKPKPTRPNEWWGIDMTSVHTNEGPAYVVLVLDWYSKRILGVEVDVRSTAQHWLNALNQAANMQFPHGIDGHGVHLMSDNGCQPCAETFLSWCKAAGIHQAFTSYNNPKGNADTERMFRTLKEELLWLHEWPNASSLKAAVSAYVEQYNTSYLHSSLNYNTPNNAEFLALHSIESTRLIAA